MMTCLSDSGENMKKFEMEKIKDQIKQFLTLDEIIGFYVGEKNHYTHRYKCPFNHEESKCNLEVNDTYWRCYSCGISGDEILFVQKLFDLPDYESTLLKIAQDFRLKTEFSFDPEYEAKIQAIKAERERKEKAEREFCLHKKQIYDKLIKRQFELERVIMENEPDPQKSFNIYALTKHPDYVMLATNQYNKNEILVNILNQQDISDYASYIYNYLEGTPEQFMRRVVADIVSGEIKINEKGDVVSVYGYK